jgi:hypothetical protein
MTKSPRAQYKKALFMRFLIQSLPLGSSLICAIRKRFRDLRRPRPRVRPRLGLCRPDRLSDHIARDINLSPSERDLLNLELPSQREIHPRL